MKYFLLSETQLNQLILNAIEAQPGEHVLEDCLKECRKMQVPEGNYCFWHGKIVQPTGLMFGERF